ncbi:MULTISPECIES: hypothetical protein [Bradyrhizobium]|uniref:GlsB/YeaQ/YmgE family stress response membrane protein n=3 Tax=Bradyrhizobium TaxID=374 RepID=A0A410VIJ9_9BRAD|nr:MULTISPECIES: hypothetical protein [Bradyrhizobium]MCG2628122.1 hypothetical protein [Bradyrhizobium zhengyangense]MCG2643241.1 hypothetical protein [Bradyrhizobium zhengyangense]MCG2670445.1 hypothetical protein [Bradyrhizobium zhengyangense]MDN4985820.1 hypothetical protein [Bradyrhizobium sp. WYCCWR 13022]MDN5002801.1 hypothetical protein [Bradyrhizobium sp. WYCCWR 12677]
MSVSLTPAIFALSLGLAMIASIAGGMVGGLIVGGKVLGNELAALLGGFYGPLAGIAGVFVGLIALSIIA